MDYSKRLLIEENISKDGVSCKEVCELSGIPRSTLIREVSTYSFYVSSDKDYDTTKCERLSNFPFVCNGCKSFFTCKRKRLRYSAKKAQIASEKNISRSRQIIHKNNEDFEKFNNELFQWVALNNKSIHSFCVNHPECIYSERQIYNLVASLKLKVKPIDLRSSVKRKVKKAYKKIVTTPNDFKNHREYEDFLRFLTENKESIVAEIDTVHGKKEDKKCFLTICLTKIKFQFVFLLDSCSAEAVNKKFLEIREIIGDELFYKIFKVMICDNGVEFNQLYLLEYDSFNYQRGKVFYARPYRSGDKGLAENNHRLIRYIIPKGVSIKNLTDEDARIITNTINSINKNSLNDFTPFKLFEYVFGKKILNLLKLKEIDADKLVLNSSVLKKEK